MYLRVICDSNIILAFVGSANFIFMKNTMKQHQIKHDKEIHRYYRYRQICSTLSNSDVWCNLPQGAV